MDKKSGTGPLRPVVEFFGRRQRYEPPEFSDTKLVDGPYEFRVNMTGEAFLPAFPMTSAVVVSPNGERQIAEGGYIQLPPGNYSVFYVDLRQHPVPLPKVDEKTGDGALIGITIRVTYQVADPILIQNIVKPVEALFNTCEASIKKIIHRYQHDQLIGKPQDPQLISDTDLASEIGIEVSLNEACRAFTLVNISLLNREGNAEFLYLRQRSVLQAQQARVERERLGQRKEITSDEIALGKIKTSGEGEIKELWAKFEAKKELSLAEITRLKTDLEIRRKQPEYDQEYRLKKLEAVVRELDALMHAEALSGFTKSEQGLKFVEKIVAAPLTEPKEQSEPKETQNTSESDASERGADQDSDFIHLLIPKKKK